jgi:hypothetical protein
VPEFRLADKSILRLRGKRQRGSTVLEFALVTICAIPMLFAMVALGITMGRGTQGIQATRDIGHMYGLGVDFSQTGAQSIAAKLAQDFSLNTTTGNAVFILSKVQKISSTDCNADTTVPCNNLGYPVFTHRLVLGNASLRASQFGTPPAAYIGANGLITANKYLQYDTVRASTSGSGDFNAALNLAAGEYTSMVEGYFRQPDLNFLTPGFAQANQGIYVRVFF